MRALLLGVALLAGAGRASAEVGGGPGAGEGMGPGGGARADPGLCHAASASVAAVEGDGSSELDVVVTDSWGNVVGRGERMVSWTPGQTGRYTVTVTNRGTEPNRFRYTFR